MLKHVLWLCFGTKYLQFINFTNGIRPLMSKTALFKFNKSNDKNWIMCTKGICSRVSFNTLYQYFDQYWINILILLISSQPMLYGHLITSSWLVGPALTDLWLDDCCQTIVGMMECRSSINWGVVVLIKGIDCKYQSTLSKKLLYILISKSSWFQYHKTFRLSTKW